ncbi:hypothetical protein AVMA1855_23040 [Acidovorax sp. SUPP1855]|nr:hypothetical protein AVMA1855_23040 [Acidovorax sp. SUPP1855]
MRRNLPVSTQEYPFPSGETLVSTTDLKGRILYCNPMFIEVSGYEREALLGQPHNLIRHPDMPEEAFRDMWNTIGQGRPWSAAVKNRRKNGDFYWVMANVTPLMEGDRPVGYLSVRTEASREQVQAADALYARMRAEAEAGRPVHVLRAGRLARLTALGRIAEWTRIGVGGQVAMAFLAVLVAAFLAGLVDEAQGLFSAAAWAAVAGVAMAAFAQVRRVAVLPLSDMVRAANRMAAGDLTERMRVTRSDGVGDLQKALSQLNVNLQSIVRDALQETEKMRVSSRAIAQGNQELSGRTETQASNLQETAASMEEITGTVQQTAESARQAADLARQATGVAERTSGAVDGVAATMQQIQAASGRIGEITQLIGNLSKLPNLQGLNAVTRDL